MSERIDLRTINQYVLDKQHLAGGTENSQVSQVVSDVGGLHATGALTPYLSLAARIPNFEPDALDQHLYREPQMARIRCVRKTIYVHNQQFLPVLFAATSSKVIKAQEHFMTYRGVSLSEYKVLSDSILKLLRKQPLTSAEIKEALITDFDVSSVLYYMCDQGLLVRGEPKSGWKDRRYRYTILTDVFPDLELDRYEEREAIPMLVRHYLAAFGPATLEDVIWWTGLGKIRIRSAIRGLGDEIVEIQMTETNAAMLLLRNELELLRMTDPRTSLTVNLLPSLDSYIMGYSERRRYIGDKIYDYVFDSSGNATNVILVNGRVAGVWDHTGEDLVIKLFFFDYQLAATTDLVRASARRIGLILTGQDVRIRQCEKMIPLSQQPAGAIMSPLKNM